MDVSSAVAGRRSIRRFQPADLPEDMITKLVNALLWAPSAGNLQSRKFYCVRSHPIKRQLAEAALNQTFISDAPLVFVCCADARIGRSYGQRGIELYAIQDVSASIMSMMLVAFENDIGTCWVGAFHEEKVVRILDLPETLRPVALVPAGYPAEVPQPPGRLAARDAVVFR